MRPAPTVISFAPLDLHGRRVEQVVEAEGVWFVVRGGAPVNVLQVDTLTNSVLNKYRHAEYLSHGHAFNLAETLNLRRKTDLFRVAHATAWEIVDETED